MPDNNWYARPNPTKTITYGQEENGDLIFAVRIRNLPASPKSSEQTAKDLCRAWSQILCSQYNMGDPLRQPEVVLEGPDARY